MTSEDEWVDGIGGDLPLHRAVVKVIPVGTKILSAERSGMSAWTRTGKITVLSPEGEEKRYFIKSITGQGARALAEGEYYSASAITAAAPGVTPRPVGWGSYTVDDQEHFFFVGHFHDMDLKAAPDPSKLAEKVAAFHQNGLSPTGKFGFPVTTTIGKIERVVDWQDSWANLFALQLQALIDFDNESNGVWPELDAAMKQLIYHVIPKLLGALQADGRQITPALVHGDLWEHNVGEDMETGEITIFDPGCVYAHNEMEFGTWRCSWSYHFNSPIYMRMYQRLVPPSEPVDDWDDRNRLYSIWPYLVDSAGHPGSGSRKLLYNDVLYLCEKHAPFPSSDKYDPAVDISVTGEFKHFEMSQL